MNTDDFTRFRSDIEGLRAIAVLLVVLYHAGAPVITGGFIGVDVFFVISGYLITGLLTAERQRTGAVSFLSFYARRGRRLIPAAFAMIAVTLIACLFVYSPSETVAWAKSAAASAAYVSNIWFGLQPSDYFSPEMGGNPFLHTWSLAVEEQFYLFWPLGLLLAAYLLRSRKALCWGLAILTIASFAICIFLASKRPDWAFYSLPSRVWEFSLGGLARLAITRPDQLDPRYRKAVGWIGLILVVGSACLLTEASVFPSWNAVPPVIGTAMMLVSGQAGGLIDRTLASPVMQWTGKRSYSIYLWHWPFLILPAAWLDRPSAAFVIGGLACCVLVAHASYEWLEMPVRRHKWLAQRTGASLGLTVALSLAAAVLAAGVIIAERSRAASPTFTAMQVAATTGSGLQAECIVWPPERADTAPCTFGRADSKDQIVLVGDSHAGQWFTPALRATNDQDAALVTMIKGSCPLVDIDVFSIRLKRLNHECNAWRAAALDEIIALQPKLVIVGNFTHGYRDDGRYLPGVPRVSSQDWLDGLTRTMARLDEANIPVIYLIDNPAFKFPVPNCLARSVATGRSTARCNRPREQTAHDGFAALEIAAISRFQSVTPVNFADAFCDSATCYGERDGMINFRDAHHISQAKAEALAPALSEEVSRKLARAGQ